MRGIILSKWGALLLLSVITFGLIMGGCFMSDGKREEVQQNMKEYLERTYEKEFVVEKPVLKGNEGFGSVYLAEMYPKDQPEIKCYVGWNKGEPDYYYENYLAMRRSAEGRKEIGEKLNQMFGQEVVVEYGLYTSKDEIQKLDHTEMITQHGDEILLRLRFYVFLDDFDKQAEAEKIFPLFKEYVLDNNLNMYHFNGHYFKNEYREEFMRRYRYREKFNREFSSDKLHAENKLFNALFINDVAGVNDINSLLKEFIY